MNKTHEKIKRQGPEAHAAMKRATKLTDAHIARFTKDPDDCGLTTEQLDLLDGWARGEFGYMSTGDGYVRIKHKPAQPVIMGVATPPAAKGTRTYKMGQGQTGMATTPAKNKGADLPSPDEAKMSRARQREADQRKQSMFKNPFKKTEMQPLYPNPHSR